MTRKWGGRPRPRLGAKLPTLTGNGPSSPEEEWFKCKCPPFGDWNPECDLYRTHLEREAAHKSTRR